jgi:hypothetical protein
LYVVRWKKGFLIRNLFGEKKKREKDMTRNEEPILGERKDTIISKRRRVLSFVLSDLQKQRKVNW